MSIVRSAGHWLMLPMTAFIFGMDMLIRTMQEIQSVTSQGIGTFSGTGIHRAASPSETNVPAEEWEESTIQQSNGNAKKTEEEQSLSYDNDSNSLDKNLRDDTLKLVRYKILFIKRDCEHAFREQEDLVYDNIDGNSFTAWKIAEFIQTLAKAEIKVPHKWKNYPRSKTAPDYAKYVDGGGNLIGFPDEDKKYLRVFYEVLERYPRERFRHDERQIEVLEEIRDRMPEKK